MDHDQRTCGTLAQRFEQVTACRALNAVLRQAPDFDAFDFRWCCCHAESVGTAAVDCQRPYLEPSSPGPGPAGQVDAYARASSEVLGVGGWQVQRAPMLPAVELTRVRAYHRWAHACVSLLEFHRDTRRRCDRLVRLRTVAHAWRPVMDARDRTGPV